MALDANSGKTIWVPRLRQLLEVEQRVVFVGVLISALFAVLMPGAPLLFMGICTLTIGNLMYFLQTVAVRLYSNRPFPWNWVMYLPILTAASFAGTLGAVALVRWTHRDVAPYWDVFRHSYKIIMVVSMGGGIVGYAVQGVQSKLQAKNKLLEQAVERSSAALAQQEQELVRACEIQSGLLPKVLPQHPNLELAGAWQPARTVGGDYFDVVQLDEDRLGICIGDVSGKGLTASLLMANLQAAFRAYATPEATPAAVCAKLNAFVCGNVASDKFITFFTRSWTCGAARSSTKTPGTARLCCCMLRARLILCVAKAACWAWIPNGRMRTRPSNWLPMIACCFSLTVSRKQKTSKRSSLAPSVSYR